MSRKAESKGYTILGEDKIPSAHHEVAFMVKTAAEMLGEAYGMDVSLRFSGSSTSGGAWLVTDPEGPLNVDMGIVVRLHDMDEIRAAAEAGVLGVTAEERFAQDGVDPAALAANGYSGYATFHAHISPRSLRDPNIANRGLGTEGPYVHVQRRSITEALEFLREHAVLPEVDAVPGMR